MTQSGSVNKPDDCQDHEDSGSDKEDDCAGRPRFGHSYRQEHIHPWHNTAMMHTDTRRAAGTD